MKTKCIERWAISTGLAIGSAGLGAGLTGCDRETSTSKETSTKVVETPEGKKKVTESTTTTTTKEKKDTP